MRHYIRSLYNLISDLFQIGCFSGLNEIFHPHFLILYMIVDSRSPLIIIK